LVAAWSLLVGTGPLRAGAVLVSRQSYLRATGGPGGSNGFDLTNGTSDFGRFADDLSNAPDGRVGPATPVISEAHQYSAPGLLDQGFEGAFAEGSVRAGVRSPGATASAVSNFDLTFRVTGGPALYTFGAEMGAAGTGGILTELVNVAESAATPATAASGLHLAAAAETQVFSSQVKPGSGDAQTLDKSGVLAPGLYALHVHADSTGTADESSAYYNINLLLTAGVGSAEPPPGDSGGTGGAAGEAGGTPAVAAPLPPAAWTGLTVLGGLAGVRAVRRGLRAVGA
jgi:hypothetical protein